MGLFKVIKKGLTGKRLREAKKALKELNIFLASTSPDFQQQEIQSFLQAVKTPVENRSQYQNDLIKNVLIVKLFENQPMNILRLPPKIGSCKGTFKTDYVFCSNRYTS